MAKRKRLTPARPELFAKDGAGSAAPEHDMDIFRLNPEAPAAPAPRRATPPPFADMAGAAAAEAAATEMADTLRTAREEGRLVLSLPRADVDTGYMMRDRIAVDEGEMVTLVESIRTRGQQTPIEVVALDDGRYGLSSGGRRMQALERLAEEAGDTRFDTVQALLRKPEQSADAYVAMVEENEIRVGLSYYERARIAARAVEAKIFVSEKGALLRLFHAASRTKRSKIRSFLTVVHALDGTLRFPEALPERLGLELARRLEADAALGSELRTALSKLDPDTAAEELAAIMAVLKADKPVAAPPALAGDEVVPGLHLKRHRNGSLTLSGPGLDEGLRQKLLDWLKAQG
jgi:ParB/RepB/Spo0J family partition protein